MSDYALGPHTASLGLAFSQGSGLPIDSGAARSSASTAREIENRVSANGDATGRPVGVAFDRRGALLVADDVGNTIWRVTTAGVK